MVDPPRPMTWATGSILALTPAQLAALRTVRATAVRGRAEAQALARAMLAQARTGMTVAQLCDRVSDRARVALHFHPDRLAADGRSVVRGLLDDGYYLNQFETGISNGGLGAIRESFEQRLFEGAYNRLGVPARERPRYGGLDIVRWPDGPCPRFGSCYLTLRPEVLKRCTFSFGDSATYPGAVGTLDVFEPVLAALLEAAHAGGHTSVLAPCNTVLGLRQPNVATVADLLMDGPKRANEPGRALDDYIEAQVHGPVQLLTDAEALVADPSFQGTATGSLLEVVAARYDLAMSWHQGFELDADEVPAEFRGPEVRALGQRIANDLGSGSGRLDAELLGRAARQAVLSQGSLPAHGELGVTLQRLKQLWHVLVAYGRPWA
ncbi:MAG TPA: DUF3626 domain-containing protein [Acidimicrobiales bacterium]|nr:DUF3626 domain-containing protein [Acidimicrobiales bacterium]